MRCNCSVWPAIGHHFAVTRVIRFNAFDMNCVAHQSPGLWKHPDDQSWRYKDLRYCSRRFSYPGVAVAAEAHSWSL